MAPPIHSTIFPAHTIIKGVLTKVDRIPPGDEERWLQIIRGKELVLRNGWYCVKQRGTEELKAGVSGDEARVQEQEFFSTKKPWSEVGRALDGRVGSDALAAKLGKILSELVSRE